MSNHITSIQETIERIGIYDFLGVWWPGTITITYYLCTFSKMVLPYINDLLSNESFLDSTYLFFILYTVIAYIIGVVLHELGKWFSFSTKIFEPNAIDDICKNTRCSKIKYNYKLFDFLFPIRSMKINLQTWLLENKGTQRFQEMVSYIKLESNINTKLIDSYHSSYVFARSMFLSFFLHAILFIIVFQGKMFGIAVMDIIISILFFSRGHRYFFLWVKTICIQYVQAQGNSKSSKNSVQ